MMLIYVFLILGVSMVPIDGDVMKKIAWSEEAATREGHVKWQNYMGDWVDANGVAQGDTAYTSVDLVDDNKQEWISWDVKTLVQEWADRKHHNNGFFIRATSGSGNGINFRTKEHGTSDTRPQLVVNGKKLKPTDDTYTESSTYQPQGAKETMRISTDNSMLIKFDLKKYDKKNIKSAVLKLYVESEYGDYAAGVFRVALYPYSDDPITWGIAKNFPHDKNITNHGDIYFAASFDESNWREVFTKGGSATTIDVVSKDDTNKFVKFDDKSLRVFLKEGSLSALSLEYYFEDEIGTELEEVYFRYTMRFSDSWTTGPIDGGKMPGIAGRYAGTANEGGWGGRQSDGTNGWSSRGSFKDPIPRNNPLFGHVAMGNYVYHTYQPTQYGSGYTWDRNALHLFKTNWWYNVEQYLKINDVGSDNGIMRTWIDGVLAFEKLDNNWRTVDYLKIEEVWMNIYHGGKEASGGDAYCFIDNVVIGKNYIGPRWPPYKNKKYGSLTDLQKALLYSLVPAFAVFCCVLFVCNLAIIISVVIVMSVLKGKKGGKV